MSLSPIGDKGQRYEISCTGYPFEGEKTVIGWTEQLPEAERMATGLRRAPGATSVHIRDRWKATPEWGDSQTFTMYAGVLR